MPPVDMTTARSGSPRLTFEGRVAIVTGSGRGLGRAYAEAFAARGARVLVNDLPPIDDSVSPAHEVVEGIRRGGGAAYVSHHDITVPEEADAVVATALDVFGRLDIVVNNAGAGEGGSFADQPLKQFRDVVESHLFGTVHVTRAAWPHLHAQQYGRVVMTTSAVGLWGGPRTAAYSAAKAALVGLARALALEGAPDGILVNCVAPAAQTQMTTARFPRPNSRTWRPDLAAPAVLYLCHESCSFSGETFAAFAGHFSRVQTVQGPGVRFDPRAAVEVEHFRDEIELISSMIDARSFRNGHLEALGLPLGVDLEATP